MRHESSDSGRRVPAKRADEPRSSEPVTAMSLARITSTRSNRDPASPASYTVQAMRPRNTVPASTPPLAAAPRFSTP